MKNEQIHLDRFLYLKNRITKVIEWILNSQPLVNKDYRDILAEEVGYVYSPTEFKYIKVK